MKEFTKEILLVTIGAAIALISSLSNSAVQSHFTKNQFITEKRVTALREYSEATIGALSANQSNVTEVRMLVDNAINACNSDMTEEDDFNKIDAAMHSLFVSYSKASATLPVQKIMIFTLFDTPVPKDIALSEFKINTDPELLKLKLMIYTKGFMSKPYRVRSNAICQYYKKIGEMMVDVDKELVSSSINANQEIIALSKKIIQ